MCGDDMSRFIETFDNEQDNFLDDDLLLDAPNFVDISEDKDFTILDDEDTLSNDVDLANILEELRSLEPAPEVIEAEPISLANEESDSKKDIELELAKLKLEREELEYAKVQFERNKKEWEILKKLSEESFQAEKQEFAKKKQIEKDKMCLKTKELIDNLNQFRDFLENYK